MHSISLTKFGIFEHRTQGRPITRIQEETFFIIIIIIIVIIIVIIIIIIISLLAQKLSQSI